MKPALLALLLLPLFLIGQGAPPRASAQTTSVTYAAGWNIVGGPTGTIITGADGPLYAFPPGATAYQALPAGTPLQAGVGSWAYFDTVMTEAQPLGNTSVLPVQLPAGEWVLIGNPGNSEATVSGAGVTLYLYSPSAGAYSPAIAIPAGQGAWAISPTGGTITINSGGGPPPAP